MENYSYNSSYPDSGNSSPRSREIEYEGAQIPNSSSWDDPSILPPNFKAKFMCSYGGKIQPRAHDNQLSYIGGDTKILAVDRAIRFSSFIAKLSSLCCVDDPSSLSFKYQLPGEDLDALISVTNDDDLEHLMHEYDRLYRSSAKPTRMRLFLFPSINAAHSSCESDKFDRDRFVDALNSAPPLSDIAPPNPTPGKSSHPPPTSPSNIDFLFGLEKQAPPPPPPTARVPDFLPDDRAPEISTIQTQLQMLQVKDQKQIRVMGYDDNFPQFYSQRPPPADVQNVPVSATPASGYWSENKAPATVSPFPMPPDHQQVLVFPGGGMYHAPVMRPVAGQPGQGYYVQRVPLPASTHDAYREHSMYGVMQPAMQSSQGVGIGPRPSLTDGTPVGSGPVPGPGGYTQMTYDPTTGRPIYYAPGGGVAVSQPVPLSGGAPAFANSAPGAEYLSK